MNNHPGGNHPLYHSIGNQPNIQLLDTMFTMQPPYAEMQLAPPQPHHGGASAMNLTPQAHVVTTANDLGGQPVLIYQGGNEHHQQHQPISYKMPQMDQAPQQQQQAMSSKKDIVAEATSKIFEDIGGSGGGGKKQPVPVSQSATPTANPLPTAVKSDPTPGTSGSATPGSAGATKTPIKSAATLIRTGGPVSIGRPRGGGGGGGSRAQQQQQQIQRQQILPRLQLLEDEDDGLTCRMCLQSFWYKSQLIDHLKANHSITDPERYEREEREKKMRRIREEQQRQILAKRQRMAAAQGRGGGMAGLRGGRAAIAGSPRLGHSPAASKQPAGPRPSFQYRDGAFICDLCKKSFSDGNDMVTHWKSHVKKQRLQNVPGPGKRGRPPKHMVGYGRGGNKTHMTSRGRPITKKQAGRRGRRAKAGRSDKGKPRWTAYLVWSTRRRKEMSQDDPDLSFAEVAKNISTEWKEVTQEDKDKYQEEAEKMNASGQRKMPKVREAGSESWSSSEDPDFEEYNVKPIMLKIKKEDGGEEGGEGGSGGAPRSTRKRKRPSFFQEFENEENNLDKILDEFEQEQMEEANKPKPERKVNPRPAGTTRRRRKREETPDEPEEPVELEKTRSGRVRKKTKFYTYFDPDEEGEDKDDDDDDDEEDRDEYQPDESEPEEPEEEFVEEEEEEDQEANAREGEEAGGAAAGGGGEGGEAGEGTSSGIKRKKIALPPKKRGRPKRIMTDAEIEDATQKALSAKPGVRSDQFNEDDDEEDEEDEDEEAGGGGEPRKKSKAAAGSDEEGKKKKEGPAYKVKPTWITEDDDEEEDADGLLVKKESSESGEAKGEKEKGQKKPDASAAAAAKEAANPLEAILESDKEDLVPSSKEGGAASAMHYEDEEEEAVSMEEEAAEANGQEESVAVEKAHVGDVAGVVVGGSDVDDLMTSATAQMEEGDDKFKDIIAEGQMDQIFP